MDTFKIYSGNDLLHLSLPKRQFLVDRLIREKDSIMLAGDNKAGKSVFIFQLICSLTSQHSFLDKYNILQPTKVLYIQLEGQLEESQDRMLRMGKTQEFNPTLFDLAFFPPLQLENRKAIDDLEKDIRKFCNPLPQVIIIDPLYACCTGDLADNNMVRHLIGNFRVFKEHLDITLIVIHHTHRLRFNTYGEPIDEKDKVFFGSVFFGAFIDHLLIFQFEKKTGLRHLTCPSQRSGDIEEKIDLRLIQPDPLYFEEAILEKKEYAFLIEILTDGQYKEGLTIEELIKHTKMSRAFIYNALKEPLQLNLIQKTRSYPVKYSLKSPPKSV